MSHKIPTTLIPSTGLANLEITADVGSISVSGAFSLLGTEMVTTFVSGTSVYISGTGSSGALTIVTEAGNASPLGGILNSGPLSPTSNFFSISATQSTVTIASTIVPTNLGGTGQTFLAINNLLQGTNGSQVGFIPPGTDGQVLLGSTLLPAKFATITSTGGSLTFTFGPHSLNIEVNFLASFLILPVEGGGSGQTLLTAHGIILGEGSLPVHVTAAGTNGQVLIAANGADPKFANLTSSGGTLTFSLGPNSLGIDINLNSSFFNLILPPQGGTGRTILTAHGVIIGEGSKPVNVTAAGTDGQLLIAATGLDPAFVTVTSSRGTLTFTAGPNSLNIDVNFSQVSFSIPIFPVPSGGTGITVMTSHGVLIGEGSLPIHVTAPGTDGQALLGSSTGDPAFATISSTGQTLAFSFGHNSLNIDINFNSTYFPIPPTKNGTGQTVLTAHGVLIGEGSNPIHATAAGTDGQVFLASSTGDPAFATVSSTGGSLTFTVGHNSLNIDIHFNSTFFPIPLISGGTGQTVLTSHGVLIGEGSMAVHVTAAGTNGQLLIASSAGDPKFATVTSTGQTLTFSFGAHSLNIDVNLNQLTFNGFFTVNSGGTGRTLLTVFGVLLGEGSLPINAAPPGTDGQVLIGATGADPQFATLTSSGGTLTFTFGPHFLSIDFTNPLGLTVLDNAGTPVIPVGHTISILGQDPLITVGTSPVLTIEMSTAGSFFNPLIVPDGGLGRTVLTAYGILIGEGSLPLDVTAAGTDGQVLIAATGMDPAFANLSSLLGSIQFSSGHNSLNLDVNLSYLSYFSPLPPVAGGIGQTVLTSYGVLIGEGSNDIHVTAAGTNGQFLLAATGADPAFNTITSSQGKILFIPGPNSLNLDVDLSALSLFNPLPIASGGLGATLFTVWGVLLGEGSLGVQATSAGTDGQAFLAATGGNPAFSTITSSLGTITFSFGHNSLNLDINFSSPAFNPVPISNGGTGLTLLTTYGVLVGEGSNEIHVTAAGTDGQTLIAATGADPMFATISSVGGTLTFTAGHNSLNMEILFNSTAFTPVPPNNGGTGLTVLTKFGVLVGEGSNPIHVTAAGTDGQALLAATGADPAFATIATLGTLTFTFGHNSLNIEANFNSSFFNPVVPSSGGTGQTVLTKFGVLIGEGSNDVNVTAAGTNGQALVAATGADPAFSTISSLGNSLTFQQGPNSLNIDISFSGLPNPLQVPQGGTGDTSMTPYAVLCGGTTSTSALLNVVGLGTVGQVLTSNGPGVLPSFQNPPALSGAGQINIVQFTTSSIYIPTAGMSYCTIECVGGGGGGGGTLEDGGFLSHPGAGGGGGAGGYAMGLFPASAIGGFATILIGIGGAGGTPISPPGGAGGTSSVIIPPSTTLISATGGGGGEGIVNSEDYSIHQGGAGGLGSLGQVNLTGGAGSSGWYVNDETSYAQSGAGGDSFFGAGGGSVMTNDASSLSGIAGLGYGAGGSGGSRSTNGGDSTYGGNGAGGLVVITEYF